MWVLLPSLKNGQCFLGDRKQSVAPLLTPLIPSPVLALICSHSLHDQPLHLHLSELLIFHSPEGEAKTFFPEKQWLGTTVAWGSLFQISPVDTGCSAGPRSPVQLHASLPLHLELKLQPEVTFWVSVLIMTIIYGLCDIR